MPEHRTAKAKREREKDFGLHNADGRLLSGTLIAVAEFSNARRWIKDGRSVPDGLLELIVKACAGKME